MDNESSLHFFVHRTYPRRSYAERFRIYRSFGWGNLSRCRLEYLAMKFRVNFTDGSPQIVSDVEHIEIVDGILFLFDTAGVSWEYGLDCISSLVQISEETHDE